MWCPIRPSRVQATTDQPYIPMINTYLCTWFLLLFVLSIVVNTSAAAAIDVIRWQGQVAVVIVHANILLETITIYNEIVLAILLYDSMLLGVVILQHILEASTLHDLLVRGRPREIEWSVVHDFARSLFDTLFVLHD